MKNVLSFTLKRENINFPYLLVMLNNLDLSWSSEYCIKVWVGGIDNSELDYSEIDEVDKLDQLELDNLDEWCSWCDIIEEAEFCLEDLYEEGSYENEYTHEYLDYFVDTYLGSKWNEIDAPEIHKRSEIYLGLCHDIFGEIMNNKTGYYLDDDGIVYDDYYRVTIEKISS